MRKVRKNTKIVKRKTNTKSKYKKNTKIVKRKRRYTNYLVAPPPQTLDIL